MIYDVGKDITRQKIVELASQVDIQGLSQALDELGAVLNAKLVEAEQLAEQNPPADSLDGKRLKELLRQIEEANAKYEAAWKVHKERLTAAGGRF